VFISFPEVHVPVAGMDKVVIPPLATIRQNYDRALIADPAGYLRDAMGKALPHKEGLRGKRIAVTVGSRGIPDLDKMIRAICDFLKDRGARPFIVPAMGSHGGATAEGQRAMLEGYRITEEAMGVPILSSMETVVYGEVEGIPLHCDASAFAADGVVVFNKVKPHTDFRGDYESGLVKMIAIGMGKHTGASLFHSVGLERFPDLLPRVGEAFLAAGKVCLGVGVVQNAYDDISDILVCPPETLMETDRELLRTAKHKLPLFKFDHIDLLIVDEIGKNISGTGCDPNVIGRNLSDSFHGILDLKKLFVRGLTPEAHHNGCGLGMVDMTTRACLSDVDWEVTWTNCLTTGYTLACHIPLYANNDKEAILQCLATCQNFDPQNPRVVRIKNTLCMDTIRVSPAIYGELKDKVDVELASPAVPMEFDAEGNLQ
jgi:hypothetical protein